MSRLIGWGTQQPKTQDGNVEPEATPMPDVTAEMIDEAVDATLQDVDPSTADVVRSLWSMDAQSDVAHAYFRSRASMRNSSKFFAIDRPDITIGYAVGDEDVRVLTEYAPEFRLNFRNIIQHDHPVAAAMRVIDHNLILSKLPPNMVVKDIGGSVNFHVNRGSINTHVCCPDADSKDASRQLIQRMNLRQMIRDNVAPVESIAVALAVLNDDSDYICNNSALMCDFQAPITMSVHVHDIMMSEWPLIMERSGALLHEGCIHFSDRFFDTVEGELGAANARYEIDVASDTFSMGFIGSPAPWYRHKWSQYMCYGADQILYGKHGVYSYKIRERRGDTIFFRIMRVDGRPSPNAKQYYALPDVEVVEVKGFQVNIPKSTPRRNLQPRTYLFPAVLWNHMLTQASLEFERGALDYTKMMNYYRTIAPRQTINATLVMGGQSVPIDDVVPLVVHSCVCAAADVLLTQRATRSTTEDYVKLRSIEQESTMFKVLNTFLSGLVSTGYLLASPFAFVGNVISASHLAILRSGLAEWRPVPTIRRINAKLILPKAHATHSFSNSAFPMFSSYVSDLHATGFLDSASQDPELAQRMLQVCGDSLPEATRNQFQTIVRVASEQLKPSSSAEAGNINVPGDTAPPSYKTDPSDTVSSIGSGSVMHAQRVLAIREAIEEATLENKKTESACERTYREIMRNGTPSPQMLKMNAERLGNPDMWFVDKGLLVRSALGLEISDFHHAALYSPVPDAATGLPIRSVRVHTWKGADRVTGEYQIRDYRMIEDSSYTGWMLAFDSLDIFNGPEIIKSLNAALDVRHDYVVELQQAPPGSGKTYSIVQSVSPGNVVQCPVRESISDTRRQISDKYRAQKRSVSDKQLKNQIRTVDSYLVNLRVSGDTAALKSDVLLADECFMTHAGKWYAVAGLLGVQRVMAFGDQKQIPHVPRVQASKLYVKLAVDTVTNVWTTRRCFPQLVAAWGSVYDWKVRSLSHELGSFDRVKSTKGREVPDGCVMMCMYQADKIVLRQMYAQCNSKFQVMTAHESEGKTFDHVWLHNFEMRKRAPEETHYLFFKEPYCLVACSRSRKSLLYVKPSEEPDLVTHWLQRSKDPRRIEAAKHVESAGQSLEFL